MHSWSLSKSIGSAALETERGSGGCLSSIGVILRWKKLCRPNFRVRRSMRVGGEIGCESEQQSGSPPRQTTFECIDDYVYILRRMVCHMHVPFSILASRQVLFMSASHPTWGWLLTPSYPKLHGKTFEADEPETLHYTFTTHTHKIPHDGQRRGALRWYTSYASKIRFAWLTAFFRRARLNCCHWRHRIAVAATLHTRSHAQAYDSMGNAVFADLYSTPPIAVNREAHCRCLPVSPWSAP